MPEMDDEGQTYKKIAIEGMKSNNVMRRTQ